MPEQGINYYEMFPEIRPEMSPQAIRQALEKNPAMRRVDTKSLEIQAQIDDALKVFRDEASKQEYDRKLAESRQEEPKEDPRREELENWKKRAWDYLDNGENDLAKRAIEMALELETDRSDGKLQALAAKIHNISGDYETALHCINEAILREPEEIEHIMCKAEIYFNKSKALMRDARFRDDPQLREEYRKTRARGLKQLDDVLSTTDDLLNDPLLVGAMGMKAYELYFNPDETSEAQAQEDRRKGLCLAKSVTGAFTSQKVQEVLNEEAEEQERLNRWKQNAREFYDKKDYDKAEIPIILALGVDVADRSNDAYLNWLAASIYYNKQNFDTALEYIQKALRLKPDNIYNIVLKGLIYGHKARQVSRNSQFRSSSELRAEYKQFRHLELAAFEKAFKTAEGQADNKLAAYALGHQAYALYFRPDQLDAKVAYADKGAGLDCALRAEEHAPGKSREAEKVLQAEEAEKARKRAEEARKRAEAEERRKAEEARKRAEAQERKAKQERNQRERTALVQQAQDCFNRGSYNQAANAVVRALAIKVPDWSDDYYLYRLAALSFFNSGGDNNTALNYANKALNLNPDDVYALVLKGLIYSSFPGSQYYIEAMQNFEMACTAAEAVYNREDNSANRKQYAYALGHRAYARYFGDVFAVQLRKELFPTKDQKWLYSGKTGFEKSLEKRRKKEFKDKIKPGIEYALLAEKIAPGVSQEASAVLRDCKARGLLSIRDQLF